MVIIVTHGLKLCVLFFESFGENQCNDDMWHKFHNVKKILHLKFAKSFD
jgi:hypothetical protein